MSARQHPPPGKLEIYDGQIRAGVITRRDGRFVVHDSGGRELGHFSTLRNAVRAVPKIAEEKSRA